jgi:hypothetical protein
MQCIAYGANPILFRSMSERTVQCPLDRRHAVILGAFSLPDALAAVSFTVPLIWC